MGSIRKLKDEDVNVHLLLTGSNLSELYVYDTLKEKCGAGVDSIYDVNTKSTINEMLELVNTQPFLAKKWLFVLEYSKVKSVLKDKKGVFEADTSEFLIKVKNYREYKEAKELLNKVNDIYLSFIRFYDVEFLLRDYNISPKLVEFTAKSYYSDPEQVFVLCNELKSGRVIEKRKDIVDICGISSGSLTSLALALLKEPPKTDKGKKMVLKKRIGVSLELTETYGFSKMRNFLTASVKDILDIKQLYMVGTIYDRIYNLPDVKVMDKSGNMNPVYDEKKLSKYNIYLKTIIDIPYTRIVRLYLMLKKCGKWYTDIDMVNFIYQYYEEGDY